MAGCLIMKFLLGFYGFGLEINMSQMTPKKAAEYFDGEVELDHSGTFCTISGTMDKQAFDLVDDWLDRSEPRMVLNLKATVVIDKEHHCKTVTYEGNCPFCGCYLREGFLHCPNCGGAMKYEEDEVEEEYDD